MSAIFIFSPNDSPSKTIKNAFYFIEKPLSVLEIFVFPSSPLFLPVDHCFSWWSKINLKVYDVINCLNKNFITRFDWYLEKEKRHDIETLFIVRVLNKDYFYGKIVQTICTKSYSQIPCFILANNSKHTRNSFKSKIFWKRVVKKP